VLALQRGCSLAARRADSVGRKCGWSSAPAGRESWGGAVRRLLPLGWLPLLVQPVLVFEASAVELKTARCRAEPRGGPVALYTHDMVSTDKDEDNHAAVRAVATAELDLVGLAPAGAAA
jgi:hypothetical protein